MQEMFIVLMRGSKYKLLPLYVVLPDDLPWMRDDLVTGNVLISCAKIGVSA